MNDLDSLARFPSRARARTDASLDATLSGQQLFIQGDQSIANQAGAAFRSDLNNELQALVTFSRGTAAPGTTYAGQQWDDTTANVTKKRNTANSGWIVKDTLDEAFVLSRATNTILGLSDINKTVLATAGFTQTLTAAATLGDGWGAVFVNTHASANCIIDPNGAETINGAATQTIPPGAGGIIVCNGSSFRMVVVPALNSAGDLIVGNITASGLIKSTLIGQAFKAETAGASQIHYDVGNSNDTLEVGLFATGKGYVAVNGAHDFGIFAGGNQQLLIGYTASATRYATITGSNGGNVAIGASAGDVKVTTGLIVTGTLTSAGANQIAFDYSGSSTNRVIGYGPSAGVSNPLLFLNCDSSGAAGSSGGTEVARLTAGGYFKASNSGTYFNATGAYHELRSNTAGTRVLYISHTDANPAGMNIDYTGAAPNDTTHQFFIFTDTGATRAEIRSNGGLANFSANNVNLSDERVKKLLTPFGALDASIVSPASNDGRYVPSMRDLWNAHKQMRGVWCAFQYDDQNGEHYNYGYTAQGVARAFEKAAPDLVVGWDADGRRLGVRAENLHSITGAVVTELQHRSDDHDGEIRRLRAEVQELRTWKESMLRKAA